MPPPPSPPDDFVDEFHLDLGVILSDKSTYCYPLDDFGVDSGDEIVRVESSCDCVGVEIISYYDSQGKYEDGLLISVLHDPSLMTSGVAQYLRVRLQLHHAGQRPTIEIAVDITLSGPYPSTSQQVRFAAPYDGPPQEKVTLDSISSSSNSLAMAKSTPGCRSTDLRLGLCCFMMRFVSSF